MQAASAATQFASRVGSGVANVAEKTVDRFEQFLHDSPPDGTVVERPSAGKLQSMISDIAESIRKTLQSIGISANPPIELEIQADGDVRVANDHPQAARIEATLSGNRELLDQLQQIRSLSGVNRIIVSPPVAPSA